MVEFIIITPLLMFIGLGIIQFGLIYHAKSVLNYATFEAARAGAVSNGQTDIMRKELGYRMAPVFGGSGKLRDGISALTRSAVYSQDPSVTSIEILNPTHNTFLTHGKAKDVVDSYNSNRKVTAIPNSHLRVRDHSINTGDGLTIQDANLLKIRVTYGYQMRLPFLDMEVPGITWTMRNFMIQTDPDNWMYYMRGMLPLTSTATVRMQSEAWEEQSEPIGVRLFSAMYKWTRERLKELADAEGKDGEPDSFAGCDPETGVPIAAVIQEIDLHACVSGTPTQNQGTDFGATEIQSGPATPLNNKPTAGQSSGVIQADRLVSATDC